MRFALIDQVVEQTQDRLVAVKNVTMAEEYLADHFPKFPILPGVMMLETLVQAARELVAGRDDAPGLPLVVAEARKVTYAAMVKPGQTLTVEVTLRKTDGKNFDFEGVGKVQGREAVKGRFKLRPVGASSHLHADLVTQDMSPAQAGSAMESQG